MNEAIRQPTGLAVDCPGVPDRAFDPEHRRHHAVRDDEDTVFHVDAWKSV